MNAQSRIVVSAAGTGAGKTLVALALCAVLRDAGLRVKAFKVGPDYVDARLYVCALGAPARNLDLWLDGEAGVRRHVAASARDADVVVIEGMMGLFDGDDAGTTSTARVARVLDAAVLTVLDTWTASQSAAAVALGLRAYDPQVRHLGAIVNRVGGPSHAEAVSRACARVGIDVVAAVERHDALAFPERLLGLDRRAYESRASAVRALADRLASRLDVASLVAASRSAPLDRPTDETIAREGRRPRVAYAEDAAFWFTYPETLDAVRAAGADLVSFSPLHDRDLPRDLDALWIGGGYPEDVAPELEANVAMRAAVRDAIADGMPTYAECGGFMYLATALRTSAGTFAMAGALDVATSIVEPRLHLGYRAATVATASPLDDARATVRAYEFHYATPTYLSDVAPAYAHEDRTDGIVRARCVASFFHRHFLPGDPSIARFVAAAAA